MVLSTSQNTFAANTMNRRLWYIEGPVERNEPNVSCEFTIDFAELTTMLSQMIVPIAKERPREIIASIKPQE